MYNICFKSFTGCRTLLKRQGLRKIIDNKFSVYSKFWLRYANVPFSLDKYDIYEKHFTVMNYSAAAHLEQVLDKLFTMTQQSLTEIEAILDTLLAWFK